MEAGTASNLYWTSRYQVFESSSGAGTGTPSFFVPIRAFAFNSVVTFSSLGVSGSTIIDGSRITTGFIRSTNWDAPDAGETYADAGTAIYLDTGDIISKNFTIIGGNASFRGHIEGLSGTFAGAVNGGTINIGSGKFVVNSAGDVTMAGSAQINGNSTLDGYLYLNNTGVVALGTSNYATNPPKTWLNKNGIRVLTYDINSGTESVTGGDMRWYPTTTATLWDARIQSMDWDSATNTGFRDGQNRKALLFQAESYWFSSLNTAGGNGFWYDGYIKELYVDGSIKSSGNITAYYTSDERLKTNVLPLADPLQKIKSIGGYSFDWVGNNPYRLEGHDVGVIAQEIQKVLPEVVTEREDGYLAVRYEKIVTLLIEGMKEQQKQIEELKNKLDGITK